MGVGNGKNDYSIRDRYSDIRLDVAGMLPILRDDECLISAAMVDNSNDTLELSELWSVVAEDEYKTCDREKEH